MNHSMVANKNFYDAGVNEIIDIIEGRAKEVLSRLLANYQNNICINNTDNLFDFVFIDADKENLIIPMVKIGGIIATDNMLYPENYQPQMTKYANYVRNKTNIETVTVPVGNGEEITIKLA
jgi:caffeoyl-CoA O-methyltransferase